MRRVVVEACARIHMGFYNIVSERRLYGGVGMAIDGPCLRVEARASEGFKVPGELLEAAHILSREYGLGGVEAVVSGGIPRHVGLGSTTQLFLAFATAYTRLYGLRVDPLEAARVLGRARVSGIGLYAFKYGGFIVDSGRPRGAGGPVGLLARLPVPRHWRLILVRPLGRRGLGEEEEEPILGEPRPLPVERRARLYELLLTGMLPCLRSGDARCFGEALTEYQRILGEYYSDSQGGVFSTPESGEAARLLLEEGAYGVGQSSWGPTVYAVADARSYRGVLEGVRRRLGELGIEACIRVARPRNRGARIHVY